MRITAMRRMMKMNDNIRVFEHRQFGRIRTVSIDGIAWFVGMMPII